MEQSIIDKYLTRKQEEAMFPAFEKMLSSILYSYDLSIFERIIRTISQDNTITIDMKTVNLDNKCIELVSKFIDLFDNDIEPIVYSKYDEIIEFVRRFGKENKNNKISNPINIVGDNIDIKYFNDVDNFNNYLRNIFSKNFN